MTSAAESRQPATVLLSDEMETTEWYTGIP